MKLMKYILIIGIFVVAACTEPLEVTPATFSKVFTGDVKKAWSVRSIQFIQAGKTTQTFTLDPCITDDLYIFYNNYERLIQVREGKTTCNDGDPDLIAETSWGFSNATSTLNMPMPLLTSAPYPAIPFILKEVDDNKMIADIYFEDGSAYRFNFKATSAGD